MCSNYQGQAKDLQVSSMALNLLRILRIPLSKSGIYRRSFISSDEICTPSIARLLIILPLSFLKVILQSGITLIGPAPVNPQGHGAITFMHTVVSCGPLMIVIPKLQLINY